MFGNDIAMDLGTATILIFVKGKGIVLNEPSVVAQNRETGKIESVGTEAQRMIGRTPGNIVATRPLRDGVISDYEVTQKMIKEFIRKVCGFSLVKPRLAVCVPSGITEVEERAVLDAGIQAGARQVYIIEEPIAAAIGAGIDIWKPNGNMVIDMGGGTTDTLVYVNGSPFSYHSIPAGGTQVTSDISILKNISMDNAEKIKIDAGCCWEQLMESDEFVIVPGVGGRPPVSIPRMHIMGIIKPRLEEIFKMVRQHIDSLNLSRNLGGGVVLTGGGAQLTGVTELAGHILGLPARLGSPIPCRELEGLVEDYRTPSYATAVGLVLEGAKRSGIEVSEENPEIYTGDKNNKNIVKKFTEWLTGEFF